MPHHDQPNEHCGVRIALLAERLNALCERVDTEKQDRIAVQTKIVEELRESRKERSDEFLAIHREIKELSKYAYIGIGLAIAIEVALKLFAK